MKSMWRFLTGSPHVVEEQGSVRMEDVKHVEGSRDHMVCTGYTRNHSDKPHCIDNASPGIPGTPETRSSRNRLRGERPFRNDFPMVSCTDIILQKEAIKCIIPHTKTPTPVICLLWLSRGLQLTAEVLDQLWPSSND